MSIPTYESVMLPMLEMCANGAAHHTAGLAEPIADHFQLTAEERREMIPSGQSTVLRNRVGWARTHLKQAGLVHYPKRGFIEITDRGRSVLENPPEKITTKFLEQYPEFIDFRNRSRRHKRKEVGQTEIETTETEQTPDDMMTKAYQQMRGELEAEILENIKSMPPAFFENLVVDLLVAMGYGGNRQDAGRAVGQSSDEGIDGVINEDILGLDIIYLQAKRWESSVSRPEIQKFAGALQGQRARKGVFLTTSSFTSGAQQYVQALDTKIILIDGDRLASLLVDHDVGVESIGSYVVKSIDADYFNGD